MRYPEELLHDIESVQRARVPTPSGAFVPISAIATVTRDAGPNYILRENVERRLLVSANASGRDIRSLYEDVRARIEREVELPPGVRVEYAGQFEREASAGQRLAGARRAVRARHRADRARHAG